MVKDEIDQIASAEQQEEIVVNSNDPETLTDEGKKYVSGYTSLSSFQDDEILDGWHQDPVDPACIRMKIHSTAKIRNKKMPNFPSGMLVMASLIVSC